MGHPAWRFHRGFEEPVRQPWRLSQQVCRVPSGPGLRRQARQVGSGVNGTNRSTAARRWASQDGGLYRVRAVRSCSRVGWVTGGPAGVPPERFLNTRYNVWVGVDRLGRADHPVDHPERAEGDRVVGRGRAQLRIGDPAGSLAWRRGWHAEYGVPHHHRGQSVILRPGRSVRQRVRIWVRSGASATPAASSPAYTSGSRSISS